MDAAGTNGPGMGSRTPLVAIPRMLPVTYRSSATRATVAMVLVGIAAAMYAVQLVMTASQMGLLDAAAAGTLSQADAEASDARLQAVSSLATLTYLISAIGVLAWLWRAVGNLPMLTARASRWTRNEAIGWWFAPFANWVMPYRVVRDSLQAVAQGASTTIVAAWWACHVGAALLGVFVLGASRSSMDTLDGIRGIVMITSVMLAVDVLAGLLLMLVIRRMEGLIRLGEHASPVFPGAAPAWDPGTMEDPRTVESVAVSPDGPAVPPPPPATG
jgi:hypothetical protein